MTDFCQLWLTCADKKEAAKIANTLLAKHLVACVRQMSVTSGYLWHQKIEHGTEILLVMTTRQDFLEKVEAEIAKLHSYNTFALEAIPIKLVSEKTKSWLDKELISGQA